MFPEFRFKPVVDRQFGVKLPFLLAHPITLLANDKYSFKKPLLIVRVRAPVFDMILSLLTTGYDEVNQFGKFCSLKIKTDYNFYVFEIILDTDDPKIGKSVVTLLESLLLSTNWDNALKLTNLHSYFFGLNNIQEIKQLQLSNITILPFIKARYIFKSIDPRPSLLIISIL